MKEKDFLNEEEAKKRILKIPDGNKKLPEKEQEKEMPNLALKTLDNSQDAIGWVDAESRFVYVNEAACILLGYSRDELLRMTLRDLDPIFRPGHWNYYWKELKKDRNFIMESIVHKKNGSMFPIELRSNYIEYGEKELDCIFFYNISEKKRLEKDLNIAHFSINTAPDAIFWITENGKIIYANDSASSMVSYSRMDLLDRPFWSIDRNLDGKTWKEFWETAKQKKCFVFESAYFSEKGEIIPVESKLSYLNYARKEYICVYSRDISQRIKTNTALRESEERMGLAIRGAGIGIWDWNIETGKMVVSKDWIKMLGYSVEEFSQTFEEMNKRFFYPEETRDIEEKIKAHLKGNSPLFRLEHRMRCKEGNWIWTLNYGEVVLRDSAGKPLRMSGIYFDITEMRNNREALRQTNEKLNLLNRISRHDIMNQVSVAAGYLELLNLVPSDETTSKTYLKYIRTAIKNIQSQLNFTQNYQDMGVRSAEWQVVENIVRKAAREFLQAIDLETEVEKLEIFADPLFEKVFYNLMDNSIRHGERVSKIRISSHGETGKCILSYEDNGIGIPLAIKERIFEKEFGKNTGYGLFLIKEILDITGISIKENGLEGKGVRFEMEVPEMNYRFNKTP